jgi:integrase/recombinase XerD
LKSFFRWCYGNDLAAKNPSSKLSSIKGDREPTMPYEPEQMKAIIGACSQCGFTPEKAIRVRALSLLMRWSGLSIIDAASLPKTDLRFAKGIYRVVRRRIKTGVLVNNKIRPPSPSSCWRCRTPIPSISSGLGRELRKSIAGKFSNDLKEVFIKAGITDGHPHRFRDTAAVELLKHNVDIRKVSKFLGHKSVTTTERYYAPWNKAQQDIMDDAIGAAQEMMEIHI